MNDGFREKLNPSYRLNLLACLRANGCRALVQRCGIGEATLLLVEAGQIVQHVRDLRIVRTERLFEHGHRALEQRVGGGLTTLVELDTGAVARRERGPWVVGTGV